MHAIRSEIASWEGAQELHGLLTHNQHLRIRALRIAKGLTLESVATHAGATRSRLSKVENFPITPSLPALGQIAEAPETTVSERSRIWTHANVVICIDGCADEYARASTRACGSRGKARRPNVTYLLSAISVNPA